MKALGARAGDTIEGSGKDMLFRVLLHVFEAARPVDGSVHDLKITSVSSDNRYLEFTLQHVQNLAFVGIHDVDDTGGAQLTGVERLSARCRIKGRAIQHDCGTSLVLDDSDYRRVELGEIG